MCTAICINDQNRPKEIPQNKWLKSRETYEIIFTTLCKPQNEIGVHLAEIELDESCSPYEFFMLNRFSFSPLNFDLLLQLIKDCTNLDFDVNELLKQTKIDLVDQE